MHLQPANGKKRAFRGGEVKVAHRGQGRDVIEKRRDVGKNVTVQRVLLEGDLLLNSRFKLLLSASGLAHACACSIFPLYADPVRY